VAKSAGNNKSKSGKGKSAGKQAQGKKAPAKRADAKPTRGKTQQKSQQRSQQKPQQKAKASRPAEKKGLIKFLRDVRTELSKVTWPTRKDLAQSTLVVLVAVAIAAAYTSVIDLGFSRIIDVVVNFLT
jgi:preprotein translocase subunit SecE